MSRLRPGDLLVASFGSAEERGGLLPRRAPSRSRPDVRSDSRPDTLTRSHPMEMPRLDPQDLLVTSFDVNADYSQYDTFKPYTADPTGETRCFFCPVDP